MGSCSFKVLSGCRYLPTVALYTVIVSDHDPFVCDQRQPRMRFCISTPTSVTLLGSTPHPRSSPALKVVHGSNVDPSECSSAGGCGAGRVYGTVADGVADWDSAPDETERTASPAVGAVQAAATPTSAEAMAISAVLLHARRMRINRDLVTFEGSGVVGLHSADRHLGGDESVCEGVIVLAECFQGGS